MREIKEIRDFNRDELKAIACRTAEMAIVGGMYIGKFLHQYVEDLPNGGIRVITQHCPAEITDYVKHSAGKKVA